MSSSFDPLSSKFPAVSTIPLLTSKLDFLPWDNAITGLLHYHEIGGHILDPAIPQDPNRMVNPIPYPQDGTPAEQKKWIRVDGAVRYILTARLGPIPTSLLSGSLERTAFSVYSSITHYFGISSYVEAAAIYRNLLATTCASERDVLTYVQTWRRQLVRLFKVRDFHVDMPMCITTFINNLPRGDAFITIRADLPAITAALPIDPDFESFIDVSDMVLDLDTSFRLSAPQTSSRTRDNRHRSAGNPAVSAGSVPEPPAAAAAGPKPPRSSLTCSNCGKMGHAVTTCYKAGGGMEGRRAEHIATKNGIQALVASVSELDASARSFDEDSGDTAPAQPADPPDSPYITVDDAPVLAALSVGTTMNTDIFEDLYPQSTLSLAFAILPQPEPYAFVSWMDGFNSLLDSGCTHHIFRDRSWFFNLDESKKKAVGTANCGLLRTYGTGDVRFRLPYKGAYVVFTVRGCLYAPDIPINLFSVGALVERGIRITFNPAEGSRPIYTSMSYSSSHPRLAGFEFDLTTLNRLSFLNCEFLLGSESPTALVVAPVSAFPAVSSMGSTFPAIPKDLNLWHRRFSHIGMDATRAALTKSYVLGVTVIGLSV
ncbi:hypothetical protein D9613_009050 [Agrocybe pediades]|uniref:Retrovirus-related Pol polyprotein from transposon TNT 1-94-like beta-barrel domain-containing protein n=1 Tax=Agrocybe pediades TaxID=84607 RepID=A0A8H4VVX1_9AGAR|nr:hypothetical protein D9613_009050 [Agrocybe pediades]